MGNQERGRTDLTGKKIHTMIVDELAPFGASHEVTAQTLSEYQNDIWWDDAICEV